MISSIAKTLTSVGAAAGCLVFAAGNAQAFTFDTEWSGAPPKGDIYLESVKIGNSIVTDFALVNGVTNFVNPQHTGGNTGAASSDRGDHASGTVAEDPDASDIVASLGNNRLSSIVDGEDGDVSFSMDLTFDKAINKLLFWERGINSSLGVTINGVTKVLTKNDFALGETDFTLDTTEINKSQKVGSYGLNLSDFGVVGNYTGPVTVFSEGGFNGPDFKVFGASVPEPATVLGLIAAGGAVVATRRRKNAESAQ